MAKSVLNAVSWSLHVVSGTNVLDEIRFSFTESLPSKLIRHKGEKTAASSSKRRHNWVMKLNKKRVAANQEFHGVCWSFVPDKMWSLLYGKPG